jgi:hypothetical protein
MINSSYCFHTYINSDLNKPLILHNENEPNYVILQIFITLYILVYLTVLCMCDVDLLSLNDRF